MEDIIKSLILQAPAVAITVYALYIVYGDWKKDRETASAQRDTMIEQLTLNTVYLQTLATKLNINLPSKEDALSGLHKLDVT